MQPEQSEAATLLYLQEAIATVRDTESLFQIITDKLRLILPFDAMVITMIDAEQHYKRVYIKQFAQARTQLPPPSHAVVPTPVAGSPLELFIRHPELTVVSIAELQQGYPGFVPLVPLAEMGLEWLVAIPLRTAGSLVGVMSLSSRREPQLTPPERTLLQRIGQQVALAVQTTRALAETEHRAQQAGLQLAVNNALLLHKNRGELLRDLATEIDRVIPHLFFGIRIQQPDGRVEVFSSFVKRPADVGCACFESVDVTDDDTNATAETAARYREKVAMQRQAAPLYRQAGVYVGEAFRVLYERYQLIQHIHEVHGVRSVLYVPLTLRVAGNPVLMLADRREHAFTPENLQTVRALAPQISLALDNLFAFEQIEALRAQLEQEKSYLLEEIRETSGFDEIIGTAPVLRTLLGRVEQVAATDTTVLIQGETGTGKELIARALHHRSPRQKRPLVKINCAALPAQLIESELFGHEKGAFTGALERRIGKFELADSGTIFLDEVGELPLDLQAKLLRVLQEKEIERVGGRREIKVDVRVIAATNRVLAEEVAAGRFRQDLYYRLTAFPLTLPPLRERPDDVPPLVAHFQEKLARRMGKPRRAVRTQDMVALQTWRWPGNIRELEHVLEQAVIVSNGPFLDFEGFYQRAPLPGAARVAALPDVAAPAPVGPVAVAVSGAPAPAPAPLDLPSLREQERAHIMRALRQTGGRVSGPRGAARLLDINAKTLEARMRRLGIRRVVEVTT